MDEYLITIPGKPVGKARPRFKRFGGTYDPQSDINKSIKIIIASQWLFPVIEGPISVGMRFYMPIPKSTSKKNRIKMISGEMRHVKKPDLDNMVKGLDNMTGIVFKDDNQIYQIYAEKRYSENPRTEINIIWNSETILI